MMVLLLFHDHDVHLRPPQGVLVEVLNWHVFVRLASMLNRWENYRTTIEFEKQVRRQSQIRKQGRTGNVMTHVARSRRDLEGISEVF